MRTDGGFKKLPEKQHERKEKKEGWVKQKTGRKGEKVGKGRGNGRKGRKPGEREREREKNGK